MQSIPVGCIILGERNRMKILFAGDLHLHFKTPISRLDDYPNVILDKLDLILKQDADYYIFAGDIFHSITNFPEEYMVKIINFFKKYEGKNIFSIIGNHDTNYGRSDLINNSPLGILFATGLVQRLVDLKVDGYEIVGCDYDQVPPVPKQVSKAILVAHKFYMEHGEKENITDEEADRFEFVMLGHDHSPHPFERNIFRIGSVSRMTGSKENTERDYFSVLIFDTETTKVMEKKFPVSSNVFNESFLDLKRELKKESVMNMNKIFERVETESLDKVLELENFSEFSKETKDLFKELYGNF